MNKIRQEIKRINWYWLIILVLSAMCLIFFIEDYILMFMYEVFFVFFIPSFIEQNKRWRFIEYETEIL